jgi:hypothetical protein
MEAQSHITAFINDQLDMATLEDFLSHVNQCAECREELEVYYALLTAMKLLDEDKELSDNFHQELEHKLKASADKIRKTKVARIRKKFYLMMIALGFVIVSSITVTKAILIPTKPQKPSFVLGYRGVPDYLSPVQNMVQLYDEEARQYTAKKREIRIKIYEQLKKDGFGRGLVLPNKSRE